MAISYRDKTIHDIHARRYQFPASGMMTHGIIRGKDTLLGGGEPLEKFCNDVMLTLCRGITKWEMNIIPRLLTDSEWTFVSRAFRWAKANWGILCETMMFGGDPQKGEIYGYAHFQGDTGIICLRNPAAEAKKVQVRLDGRLGLQVGDEKIGLGVRVIYPYEKTLDESYHFGEKMEWEVQGCEVVTAYIGPRASLQGLRGLQEEK